MLNDLFRDSQFLGMALSLGVYFLFVKLKKRLSFVNPLLFAILFLIGFLKLAGIDYAVYNSGAQHLSYLLTPVTVAFAIPLYRNIQILKRNALEILLGILSGVLSSAGGVLALAYLFGLSHQEYVTLLPKSITTAIGMGICTELGGYVNITVGVIMITGIFGNIFGERILRLVRVKEPIARGLAMGTSSHAFGTSKALEMGEVEGAVSSLSVAVAGLMTVIVASIFANLL